MTIYHWFVIAGVFVASCSQVLLKQSASRRHASAIGEMLNWRVILSYFIFFATVLVNTWCLGRGVMVKDMPIIESLGYIFVPLLSCFLLSERISLQYLLSLGLILCGIVVYYI